MKLALSLLAMLVTSLCASHLGLTSVKQPVYLIDTDSDSVIRIVDVPYVTRWADPEWRFKRSPNRSRPPGSVCQASGDGRNTTTESIRYMKRYITAGIGLCLLGIPALWAETPAQFVERIYSSKDPAMIYLDEKALSLYTPDLQKQMRLALKLNERFIKDNPADKPPLAEYFLLVPCPDQFSKVTVFTTPIDRSSRRQLVIAELRYPQSPLRDYAFITLSPKDKTWQISDIRWNREERGDRAILKNQLEVLIKEIAAPEVGEAGAGQPAARPADKPPVKGQPSTPTPKDAPR